MVLQDNESKQFLGCELWRNSCAGKDIRKAPGIKNKRYMIMPPGCHTGDHKTAKVARREYLENPATHQTNESIVELEKASA